MGRHLAATALGCGLAGLPLWLLSYAWLPFALMGHEGEFVWYAVVVGEVGAFVAGILGIGLGIAARRASEPGTRERRRASRALAIGALVLALVVVPNVVGAFLTVR